MANWKCTYFGSCSKADKGDVVTVPAGTQPKCEECGRPLVMLNDDRGPKRWPVVLALLVVVLVGYGLWMGVSKLLHRGGAPPAAGPDDVVMYYERTVEPWVTQAATEFSKSSRAKVLLEYKASRQGFKEILYKSGKQPTIWDPADVYWSDKLSNAASNPKLGNKSGATVGSMELLATTRLVLVVWSDKATVLQSALQRPEYRGRSWRLLSTLATKGWSAVGGRPEWGKLKLLQSKAVESNSAIMALCLMFNEFRRDHPGVRSSSPEFVSFMRSIESACPSFADTTSKAMDAFLSYGQGQSDMAIVYEANAIDSLGKGGKGFTVVYPSPTASVQFPAVVLDATWVTPAHKDNARRFIDYLRTSEVQKRLLGIGLRPVTNELRGEAEKKLQEASLAGAGLRFDPEEVIRPVDQPTADDLVFQWTKIFAPSELATP